MGENNKHYKNEKKVIKGEANKEQEEKKRSRSQINKLGKMLK